jgi:hypothetical protein
MRTVTWFDQGKRLRGVGALLCTFVANSLCPFQRNFIAMLRAFKEDYARQLEYATYNKN